MLAVENYIDHFVKTWENSPDHLPEFQRKYTASEKRKRENNFEQFQQKIKMLQSKEEGRKIKRDPGKSFFPMFKSFLETVFDFEKEQLDIILADEFKNVSKDFFEKARAFGPELKPENIYQGLRNVWIMNGIQLMMKIPVEITPSVFAYSMIYPYSDNLLDDPEISADEKAAFSTRFNARLHGEHPAPQSHAESQLFALVGKFEEQFSRKTFPKVYESLYAIQKGQTDSLDLLKNNGIANDEIRRICFEKGGTSVLADGYLVAGELTPQQEQALFGYGVYLQLLDDIQDVEEDACAFTKTMFSGLDKCKADEFVNQTIHFGRTALEELNCFQTENMGRFIKLMNHSVETMIIESVGVNGNYYSQSYLQELNSFSPLDFEFVRRKKSEAGSQRFEFFRKYFEQANVTSV